jgi:hypothetical protein
VTAHADLIERMRALRRRRTLGWVTQATPIHELLERVHDRASFVEFVRALEQDRRDEIEKEKGNPSSPDGPGANGWENTTIERFLESAVAWAEDTRRTGDERARWFPEEPSWKAFATFLYAGKIYE